MSAVAIIAVLFFFILLITTAPKALSILQEHLRLKRLTEIRKKENQERLTDAFLKLTAELKTAKFIPKNMRNNLTNSAGDAYLAVIEENEEENA